MITIVGGSWEPQQLHGHDLHVRDPNIEVLFYIMAKKKCFKKEMFRDLRTLLSVCARMCMSVCTYVRLCVCIRAEVIPTFDKRVPSLFLEVAPN